MTPPANERGSASVELVLLTPVLVALLLLTAAFGRVQGARADVEAAARTAARSASIERDGGAARAAAQRAVAVEMDGGGYRCDMLRVDLDTSTFGPDATVKATVACSVHLSDVTGMGIPGTHVFSATFLEPLDRYRGTR